MSEMSKKDINSVAMEVILEAGNGGDLINKALLEFSKFDFAKADDLLNEASQNIIKAHNAQTEMIQSQASGTNVEYSLLFIHAQDTLMTIKSKLDLVKGIEPTIRNLWERERKNENNKQ